MAELKTKATTASVKDFLQAVEPEQKKKDSFTLLKLFEDVTGEKSVIWGTSIIGFGAYHYKSARSSQEGDWFLTGFSPRKQNLTLYIMHGIKGHELLEKLGKHKAGGGCLYINTLSDIDLTVLKKLIQMNVEYMKKVNKVE